MIVTIEKDFAEILKVTRGEDNLFIFGCAGCATLCQTGGEKQVKELGVKLESEGKEIIGYSVLDVPCDERIVRKEFRNNSSIRNADSIIIMACGAGIQSVQKFSPIPIHPVLDSLFLGTIERIGKFYNYCSICGNCVLEDTQNLCPITRCAKGLLNGPCGGMNEGKCEVNSELDCVWVLIYEAMEKKGNVNNLKLFREPRNWVQSFVFKSE